MRCLFLAFGLRARGVRRRTSKINDRRSAKTSSSQNPAYMASAKRINSSNPNKKKEPKLAPIEIKNYCAVKQKLINIIVVI